MCHVKLKQAGDTIVEVMIVLAILGLALSISYATASQSLKNARQAQENSEATAYAKDQAESLYKLASNPTSTIFSRDGNVPFCISTSGTETTNAASCQRTNGITYTIAITRDAKDTFKVMVSWPNVNGDSDQDTVKQYYRVHP